MTKQLLLCAFSFFSIFVFNRASYASVCCGGGVSVPSLIVSDDRAQLSAAYGFLEITDDVMTDGYWRARESKETLETLRLSGSHIFQDRWQVGFSAPLVRRSRSGDSQSGLGDVATSIGYEVLPEWNYHPWRPRGWGYMQVIAPTGRSIQESESQFQLDSRGRGFWALAVGSVLSKSFARWDVHTGMNLHRSWPKTFSNSQNQGRLVPGWGGELTVGAGYSFGLWRLGSSVAWSYEDAVDVEGTVSSKGSTQRFATATLSAAYTPVEEWSGIFTFQDQTWFGAPVNTALSRGVLLQIQWRLAR